MELLRELMNFNSFWALWFWILHVITWSLMSHFTLGVPYDMIIEANREKEQGPWSRATDAVILAQVFRFTEIFRRFGIALVAAVSFFLAMLLTLAVRADLEFARALLTLLGPMTLIYMLSIRTAFRIQREAPQGRTLRGAVKRQRLYNQLVGLVAVACAVVLAVWEATRNIEIIRL